MKVTCSSNVAVIAIDGNYPISVSDSMENNLKMMFKLCLVKIAETDRKIRAMEKESE